MTITIEQAALAVIRALHAADIPYMVVGSFSSNFHGIPRSTHDADLVLHLAGHSMGDLRAHLPPELELDNQQSFELVTGTTKHVIRIPGTGFLIELFHLSADQHDQQRFSRRQSVNYLGTTIYLATAEDVIITKLRWGRSKDYQDIQNVMAIGANRLDWDYINHWCELHGTQQTLEEIRNDLPEL